MKKLFSIFLSLSLVVGTLSFWVPSAVADEVSSDIPDLAGILSTYYPDISSSVVEDIVNDTPYYTFQVIDSQGVRYYVLDTFSVPEVSNWHFFGNNSTDVFYNLYQGNSGYFITLDFFSLTDEKSYNIVHSTDSVYSGTQVIEYAFNGTNVFIDSQADPRFKEDCYARGTNQTTVFTTGILYMNPLLTNQMYLYFVFSNTSLGNVAWLEWSDMIDDNFTYISLDDSGSTPSLGISWGDSIYPYNYYYSEICLALSFDGSLRFVSFSSLQHPDYFPIEGQAYIPYSFLIDVFDIANNIDNYSRVKLIEVSLYQYGRVNENASAVAGYDFSLCNLLLFGGDIIYDYEYTQGLEPDYVFSDRPEGVDVQTVEYTYSFSGEVSNVLTHYPDGLTFEDAWLQDSPDYLPSWADVCVLDNGAEYDNYSSIKSALDFIWSEFDSFVLQGGGSILQMDSVQVGTTLSPDAAFEKYLELFQDPSRYYFTDVAIFIYFQDVFFDPLNPSLSDTTVYVWYCYTPRYYQKLKDMQVVDVFTDYSSQLKDVADAVLNDYYNNYSMYSYLHAKLDDIERNQVNYFGTSTGLLGNLNDGISVIDSHLGFISSYLSSIDSTLDSIDTRLASTLSVSDSSVQSLLRDVIDVIESLDIGGGTVYPENEIDTIQEAVEYYHSHTVSEAYDDNLYSVWFTGMVHDWWWNVNYDSSGRVHDSLLLDVFNTLRESYNSLVANSHIKGVMSGYFGALSGSSYDGSVYPDTDTKYMLFFFDGDFDPDTYEGVSYE